MSSLLLNPLPNLFGLRAICLSPMNIDVYSATGEKVSTHDLPATLFSAAVNEGLMHQAVVRQQSNRRQSPAHVKTRGEVEGSTRKLFSQKHTGRARRGSVRSPLLRGGGKAFGPRNDRNFEKHMPRKMRRAAIRSCLSLQAQRGAILGLQSFPEAIQTKSVAELLRKLPVEQGRAVLIVTDGAHRSLSLSARNIPFVKTIQAAYLNPEDVLHARHVLFLIDAIDAAERLFADASQTDEDDVAPKKAAKKKAAADSASDSDA